MLINFAKFHGFGNDYIVLERSRLEDSVDLPQLARRICNRHTGAGADGIAVLNVIVNGDADFACQIVNPDGSIAGFSGNGTRCAAAYLYHVGLWDKQGLRLKMSTGIKNFHLLERAEPGHFRFRAEIGKPRFTSLEVPFAAEDLLEDVIDREVVVGDQAILVSAINVGNPVACIFTESFDFDWRYVGREMESHKMFPERANIVFVKVIDRSNIELRIWERGAGETSASGTCAAAAAVLSAYTDRTDRTVTVRSEGGSAELTWRDDDEMVLTGVADLAYTGEFPYG